jgi:hypothetical protein
VSAGDPFETFNLAIAFPPDAPTELAANVSASIVRLQVSSPLFVSRLLHEAALIIGVAELLGVMAEM